MLTSQKILAAVLAGALCAGPDFCAAQPAATPAPQSNSQTDQSSSNPSSSNQTQQQSAAQTPSNPSLQKEASPTQGSPKPAPANPAPANEVPQNQAPNPLTAGPGSNESPVSPAQSSEQSSAQNPPNNPQPQQPAQPAGTAVARKGQTAGGAASQPAGTAIAPAKQRQVRSWLIKLGVIAAAGAAVGTVYAVSRRTPSTPPGATTHAITH